jgi:hypothetical protein
MQRMRNWGWGLILVAVLGAGWQAWTSGQQPAAEKGKESAAANRLDFEVVQSFDAKYEGDTPGHIGRAGGLATRRPHVALGDAIYRGEEKVGMVTGLTWNRTNGSLDIEFDPAELVRISVGDSVWMMLDGTVPAKASESKPGK